MRFLLVLTMAAVSLWAQDPPSYTATRTSTLTSSAEVITIQQPATPLRKLQFQGAAIYCSVACDLTVERDGTAATGTALAASAVNPLYRASTVSAYRSSDVGAGTTLATYTISAGGTLSLDLADKFLIGAGENFTLRTASITGTVRITVQWKELPR